MLIGLCVFPDISQSTGRLCNSLISSAESDTPLVGLSHLVAHIPVVLEQISQQSYRVYRRTLWSTQEPNLSVIKLEPSWSILKECRLIYGILYICSVLKVLRVKYKTLNLCEAWTKEVQLRLAYFISSIQLLWWSFTSCKTVYFEHTSTASLLKGPTFKGDQKSSITVLCHRHVHWINLIYRTTCCISHLSLIYTEVNVCFDSHSVVS